MADILAFNRKIIQEFADNRSVRNSLRSRITALASSGADYL